MNKRQRKKATKKFWADLNALVSATKSHVYYFPAHPPWVYVGVQEPGKPMRVCARPVVLVP